jgi:hypothetical protein
MIAVMHAEVLPRWKLRAIERARTDGASWSAIGHALGCTRQAAQQQHEVLSRV